MQYTGADGKTIEKTYDQCTLTKFDLNMYCYRLIEGVMVLKGVVLGQAWDSWPFDAKKLSCYREKGESEEMLKRGRGIPPKEELLAAYQEHNGSIEALRHKYVTGWNTMRKWLIEYGIITEPAQTPTPEPDEGGSQEPDQRQGESAQTIIPPVTIPKSCELPKDDEPVFNMKPVVEAYIQANSQPEPQEAIDKAMEWGKQFESLAHTAGTEGETMDECPSIMPKVNGLGPTEIALIELTNNARVAVRKVIANPIALALIKTLIERGVA